MIDHCNDLYKCSRIESAKLRMIGAGGARSNGVVDSNGAGVI